MFRRTVYHRMLALQQFLRQAESCTKPKGWVVHQRSCSCITKLTAAIVSCNDEPDDEAFFGILERASQTLNDVLIRPPFCEVDHVAQIWVSVVRQHLMLVLSG